MGVENTILSLKSINYFLVVIKYDRIVFGNMWACLYELNIIYEQSKQ